MTVKSTIKPKSARGRPSEFTQEMADLICSGIAEGQSLRSVLKPKDMPDWSTFYRWLNDRDEFRQQYAKATTVRADAQFEELNGLHDEAEEKALAQADPRMSSVMVQLYKLKADNMKWAMSKMKPKRYGDKIELEGIPANPITFVNEVPAPQPNPQETITPHDQTSSDETTD